MTQATSTSLLADVTAVLLCGGKGERLRPFTESLPKPLVPIRGKPLLEHLLRYLQQQGIRQFVLCTGYKAEAIDAFVRDTRLTGCTISCVNSGDVAMADRVLDARKHVPGRALICYGDTLANVDLRSLAEAHARARALASVTVHPLQSPFGIVTPHPGSDDVQALTEKPILPYWINIGFMLCERGALDQLQRGTDLVTFLGGLATGRMLRMHRHHDRHLTVNTEKERSEAESEIEFFTLLEGMGS